VRLYRSIQKLYLRIAGQKDASGYFHGFKDGGGYNTTVTADVPGGQGVNACLFQGTGHLMAHVHLAQLIGQSLNMFAGSIDIKRHLDRIDFASLNCSFLAALTGLYPTE
jgi:hypothetical protein